MPYQQIDVNEFRLSQRDNIDQSVGERSETTGPPQTMMFPVPWRGISSRKAATKRTKIAVAAFAALVFL